MRLWHKDLIKYLPNKQLLGQWRECCAIAKSIAEKGSLNHALINKIMNYPLDHFYIYCGKICNEMYNRGYKANWDKIIRCIPNFYGRFISPISNEELFNNWHNDRYYLQCFFNLQEKYDCGLITKEEWNRILTATHIKIADEYGSNWILNREEYL